MSKKGEKRKLMFRRNSTCYKCKCKMVLESEFPNEPTLATMVNIYGSFQKERHVCTHKEFRWFLVCLKCNREIEKERIKNVPLEVRQQSSNAYPVGHPLAREVNEEKMKQMPKEEIVPCLEQECLCSELCQFNRQCILSHELLKGDHFNLVSQLLRRSKKSRARYIVTLQEKKIPPRVSDEEVSRYYAQIRHGKGDPDRRFPLGKRNITEETQKDLIEKILSAEGDSFISN